MHSKSGLFLMELIISILFFSLAGAVCIQLFVKAHFVSRDAGNETSYVTITQNMAEAFYSCDGDCEELRHILSSVYPTVYMTSTDIGKYSVTVYFDEDLNNCNTSEASYFARLSAFKSIHGMTEGDIVIQPYLEEYDEEKSHEVYYGVSLSDHNPIKPLASENISEIGGETDE